VPVSALLHHQQSSIGIGPGKFPKQDLIRVAQTAFILFSTFLDLRPVSDASD
jgi:hypothetical protein